MWHKNVLILYYTCIHILLFKSRVNICVCLAFIGQRGLHLYMYNNYKLCIHVYYKHAYIDPFVQFTIDQMFCIFVYTFCKHGETVQYVTNAIIQNVSII